MFVTPIVTTSTQIEPQFYDLDPMNVVWHGNYARFFEHARRTLLNAIDYGYEQMRASGYMWPVIDMQTRYYRPLSLGQQADVAAGIVEWENRLKIQYEISNAQTGERLTKGYTIQVAVSLDSGEMQWETPSIFRQKLDAYLALVGSSRRSY